MDYRNFKTLEEFETYFYPYIKKIDENKELILDIVNKKQDVGQNIYSNVYFAFGNLYQIAKQFTIYNGDDLEELFIKTNKIIQEGKFSKTEYYIRSAVTEMELAAKCIYNNIKSYKNDGTEEKKEFLRTIFPLIEF